jgi:flagellar biosynthetic protein FliP
MKIILPLILLCSTVLFGADSAPFIDINFASVETPEQLSKTLNVAIILTLLVFAPTLLLMATSFTRFIIVFSLLRQSMGLQQTPPNQILISISLILTFYVMQPVGQHAYNNGIKPYMEEKISYDVAFDEATKPFKAFMLKNTRESDLALFYRIKGEENPKSVEDVSLFTIMPAFVVSELKTAFEIGFLIFLPFLVIDFIVSSVLMSLGMMMLPPVMISLPIKIIFFVIVDGWALIIGNLVQSFKV